MYPQQVQKIPDPYRNDRWKLIIALLTFLSGLALVPPAWWNMQGLRDRVCLWTGAFCEAPEEAGKKQPEPTRPEQSVPKSLEHERLLATVPGLWQSGKSGKRYLFSATAVPEVFDVYTDQPNASPVKIGSARITGDYLDVTLNITIAKGDRSATRVAVLRLALLQGGQTLDGSFKGMDTREAGPVTFWKV
jgi:hypothetical protein